MLLCYTYTCKHTQLDQKSWLVNEGKGHASINRCLAVRFWRVFFSLPLKSVGFCLLLSPYVWHANVLPFWQLFIYHKHWSKRAWSLRDMGWGFNQPGVALRLSIGFMTSPCLLAVVWWPVMQWIQHLLLILSLMLHREGSHSRMNSSIVRSSAALGVFFRLLCCE